MSPGLQARAPREAAQFENRWRTYLPDLGQYLSPDPMHQASVMSGAGPQAYAYANGNPLRYIDPTGQVSFDKESYRKNCDKCCEGYEPEAGLNTALRWSAQPKCRQAWQRNFGSSVSSLTQILAARTPVVYWRSEGSAAEYDRWSSKIYMRCNLAKKASRNAAAATLIHELVHYGQWRRDQLDAEISWWSDSSPTGPIEAEAYGLADECLGSLGSTQ